MTELQAAQWLRERDNFLLLTHVRPDGDTLGSASALALALQKLGKRAWVGYNSGVTETYAGYMEGCYPPADFVPEHVVAVDIATEHLLPAEFEPYRGGIELCIDHHPSNEGYAGETCLDASAAACGEIVYRICKLLGEMDAAIAKQLYIAITTDCGCFVYNNTTPATHRIAAELMEYGDFWKQVNRNCFQTLSLKEIKLQQRLLGSMEFFDGGRWPWGPSPWQIWRNFRPARGTARSWPPGPTRSRGWRPAPPCASWRSGSVRSACAPTAA